MQLLGNKNIGTPPRKRRPLWNGRCVTPAGRLRQVRETLRDVQFLHNDQFFAAAQKKYVYIYDKRGIEVHCLKARPLALLLHSKLFVGSCPLLLP